MQSTHEFRIFEEYASQFLPEAEGKCLMGLVRLVRWSRGDPRIDELASLHRDLKSDGKSGSISSWDVQRTYSKGEIAAAACFRLVFKSVFEPAGEECGTTYDESTGCPNCGAGAQQTSPLFLDVKRIPKSKDVCRTIAGEVVVTRRVAELFARHEITGAELRAVCSKGASSVESKEWFQLIVQGSEAEVCAPTLVGINPFDNDEKGECRCSLGDLIGLNLLSEITIASASRGSADIFRTRQFIGIRRGLLRPEQLILISPKLAKLIESEKLKGCGYEVAHLV